MASLDDRFPGGGDAEEEVARHKRRAFIIEDDEVLALRVLSQHTCHIMGAEAKIVLHGRRQDGQIKQLHGCV